MRIRLRKPLSGISSGVSLGRFIPGVVYDVDPAIGAELMSWGAEVVPSDEPILSDEQLIGGVTVIQAEAADHPPQKRKHAKRRRRVAGS